MFQVKTTDQESGARCGVLTTAHGAVETPAFMPVGSKGVVKSVSPGELREAGAEMVLANTYHLLLRPGCDVIEGAGGLHRFMGWDGPLLTDSGGYQVYSLAQKARVSEEGVTFQSHLDGSFQSLSPERVVEAQAALGVDIAMVLDVCPPADAERARLERAVELTTRWARRSKAAWRSLDKHHPLLFGIIQGGLDAGLRLRHLEEIASLEFDGYALGGLSVGEEMVRMYELLDRVAPSMPDRRPRYLMGVGRPQDILRSISSGIDLFDCVLPTRNARNGQCFTPDGVLTITHARYARDFEPLQEDCPCPACRAFSRAYLRHLFISREILAHRLLTLHNLTFYLGLLRCAREAIDRGDFPRFARSTIDRLECRPQETA